MKKIAIYFYDLDRIYQGGFVNGGGAVVDIAILNELSKMKDIDLTIFSTVKYTGNELDAKIIYVEKDFQKISEAIKKEGCEVVLAEFVEGIEQIVMLHIHSQLFKMSRVPFFFRPIKFLLNLKEIKKQKKYFENFKGNSKFSAPSKKIKQDYVKNYKIPEDRVFVNYLGCDKLYETCPETTKKDKITFGLVANSSVNKGGQFALLTFGKLKKQGYDFKLKLIVKRPQKDFITKFLVKLLNLEDNVEILPRFENMEEFYSQIDCMLLPSLNESFGLVVTEAMSRGIPSIASETTGVAELINNENGFVFKRNQKEFAKKLKEMIELYEQNFEGFKTLRKNAFETSNKYTWKLFAENLINCLDK